MKFKTFIAFIKVSILLMMTGQALAQLPDLTFNPAATASDYPGSPLTTVSMNFQIQNIGTGDAIEGAGFTLNYNDSEFTYNAALSTLDTANSWSCFTVTGQINCSSASTPAGYDFVSTLAFDVGSTTAPNTYPFTGTLVDIVGNETNLSNNNIVTGITISPALQGPDVVIDMQSGIEYFEGAKIGLLALEGSVVSYKIAVDAIDVGFAAKNTNVKGVPVSGPATNVVITHAIPAGLIFDSFSTIVGPNLVGNCNESAGVVTCTIPSLPVTFAEDSIVIRVLVDGLIGEFVSQPSATVTADNDDNPNNNSASAFGFTIAAEVDLEINEQAQTLQGVTKTNFDEGEDFQYVITVSNVSFEDVDNFHLRMTDQVPLGLTIGPFVAPVGWDCSSSDLQNNIIRCDNSTIFNASTSVDFIIPVSSLVAGQYNNSASIDFQNCCTVLVEANLSNNNSSSNVSVGLQTGLTVDVFQNPNPIEANMPFSLTIDINNTGTTTLFAGLEVENTLPPGFSYATAVNKGTICNQNGLTLICSLITPIQPGLTESIIIPVQAINTIDQTTTYTNTTTVSGSGLTTPFINTIVFNVNSAVVPEFDVGLTKSASVSTIAPNSPFSYVLSVSNLGSTDATGLIVQDILPQGIQLVSIRAPDWSCTGTAQVSCMKSSLAAGSMSNVILNVISPAVDGVINNSAQVTIAEQDTNVANDNSEVNVNVMTGAAATLFADLQLTKTTSSPTLVSGEQFSWTIDVLNNGPDAANNIVVSDLLPMGFEFESVTINDGLCQNTETDITCQIPFIFNQDVVSIVVVGIAVVDSGAFDSTATVVADSTDPVPGNNTGSVNVVVTPSPVLNTDLSVTIDSGDGINQGDSTDFIINVLNNGPDDANPPELNIAVTGLLDAISINQGNDWTCQTSNFVVNCTFNGTVLELGQLSSVGLTVNTSELVLDAEDLVVTATVATTDTDFDSNLANNTAVSQLGVEGTPTEGSIEDALRGALGGNTGDPVIDAAIDAVSGYCEVSYFTALEGLCDSLYDAALEGDREAVDNFLRQITPNQVIGQSTSVSEIASAQFRNVGARLNQLRGGGGSGFSAAGLNARYGNGSIPLGMLSYLKQSDEEADGISQLPDDFITPWGFFVNGSITMGERDATGKELGFDFDSYGLTAGFDYRLDAKKVIGIALGYASFDSNITKTANLNSTGVTLTGYGSFYINDNLYVDARISYGQPKFDQSRDINFTLGGTQIQRTAAGDTNANQYSASMSAGYSFYKNAWNITPNASINYVNTKIDGFTETGAGDFNIIYSGQNLNSMVWSAGIRVSKAISLKKGVITPQFDFDYSYESKNNGEDIITRFINAPEDQLFIIATDSPDRSYGSAGLGLVYISANGKQAYINYRSVLGLEGFSRGTFNIGARFEF